MVMDTSGNFETYNTFSNSTIPKKYYTPLSHNTVFEGFFCSENPRHAMYKYHIQGLIIPHHYYICMFKLIDQLTKYCPKQIIHTDTGMIINANFPVTRCEFATVPLQPRSKHINYRIRHPKCRFNWVWLFNYLNNWLLLLGIYGNYWISILYSWFWTLCQQLSRAASCEVFRITSTFAYSGWVTPVYGS